jgi:hypothetical protein
VRVAVIAIENEKMMDLVADHKGLPPRFVARHGGTCYFILSAVFS